MYPHELRVINYSLIYSDIAILHYYNAKTIYKRLADKWDPYQALEIQLPFFQHILIAVTFSQMAIESFINDYASACLSDAVFEDDFGSLNIVKKFQIVAMFLLHAEFDKSHSYYSLLKQLVKTRNDYVHNKSKKSDFQGYTLQEINEIHRIEKELNVNPTEPITNIREFKNQLAEARDAIKAIRDIALYFDKHDNQVYAIERLLGPNGFPSSAHRIDVLKELKVTT